MKRVLSLTLALLMMLMLAVPMLVLSVGATGDDTSSNLSLTPVTYTIPGKTVATGSATYDLTKVGLQLVSAGKYVAGFQLDGLDQYNGNYKLAITVVQNRTVNEGQTWIGMNFADYRSTNTIGTEEEATKIFMLTRDATYGQYLNTDKRLNTPTWTDGEENTGTGTNSRSNATKSIFNAMAEGTPITYTLTVNNKELASLAISIDNQTVLTYAWNTGSGLSAATDQFYFGQVTGKVDNKLFVTDVTVTDSNDGSKSVDFAGMYAKEVAPQTKYAQMSLDKTSLRVIAQVPVAEADFAKFDSVGFEVTLNNKTIEKTTKVLYKSINTNTDPYVADDGKYLVAMKIEGLDTTETYSFTVRSFILDIDGTTHYYGNTVTFSVVQGEVNPDGNI